MAAKTVETFIEVNAGFFEGSIQWSCTDLESGSFKTDTFRITDQGALAIMSSIDAVHDDGKSQDEELHIDIEPTHVLLSSLHSCSLQIIEQGGVIFLEPFTGPQHVYLKSFDKSSFIQLFSALVFWQGLKPNGVLNKKIIKRFNQKQSNRGGSSLTPVSNLLVASCKIHGLLPSKAKNIEILKGPVVDIFHNVQEKVEYGEEERWFSGMVILKSNGLLELINESDGNSIYCIDITRLEREEIKELHHSIFQSSNFLHVGKIAEFRKECVSRNTLSSFDSPNYIISNQLPKLDRIILEFPYRIDVDDWLIALKSFTIAHYVGLDNTNLLRVSRAVNLQILECSPLELLDEGANVYAEVQVWNIAWFRTAVVTVEDHCAFFRETFDLTLPLTTNKFMIVLKQASSSKGYDLRDRVIGFTQVNYSDIETGDLNPRISLANGNSQKVGSIFVTISKESNYILPPSNFTHFEKMLQNLDLTKLAEFIETKTKTQQKQQQQQQEREGEKGHGLEETSLMHLDIFQSLSRQRDWFIALIDREIKKAFVDNNGDNLYNSLFRGNSLLSKSIELYQLRIGREYLEKVIGQFVKKVISHNQSTEIDPLRIRESNDLEIKAQIIERNYAFLLKYIDELWFKIYQTSNDLPEEIKAQLSLLRKKIEMYTRDQTIMLNCITGFIFLRFFCPVLLNPKLFNLTKDHQTGEVQRTLTLISKILLTFVNRGEFGAKEPYLTRFNADFIKKHRAQLLDYLDKITLKKLDFSPKLLKLSSSLERPDIPLPAKETVKELPSVPFLIDKYLRLDQFISVVSSQKVDIGLLDDLENYGTSASGKVNGAILAEIGDDSELYKIRSLEFEKLVLTNDKDRYKTSSTSGNEDSDEDFEFGSDKFIKALLKTEESDSIFNYINANSSLKDLISEADRLSSKKARFVAKLSRYETVKDIPSLESYTKRILSSTVIDAQKHVLRYASNIGGMKDLKPLNMDSTYTSLKLKFAHANSNNTIQGLESSRSSYNINRLSQIHDLKRSPTRKLQRMIRSASLNTLSGFQRSGGAVVSLGSKANNFSVEPQDLSNGALKGIENIIENTVEEEEIVSKKRGLGRWLQRHK